MEAELQATVDALAARLGRSVVVNDPSVRLVCASAHYGDADPVRIRAVLQRDAGPAVAAYVLGHGVTRWERAAMLPAAPELELLPRLVVPLRADTVLRGLLMLIDAGDTLTAAEIADAEDAGRSIAALLDARARAADPGRRARERALTLVLDDDPAGPAAWRDAGLPEHPHVLVTVVAADGEPALRSVETAGAGVAVVEGRYGVLLQRWRRPPDPAEQARALAALAGVPVGTAAGAAEVAVSLIHRRARLALRAAQLLPHLHGVGVWADLGDYAPLLALPDEALDAALLPDPVLALRAHPAGARLLATVAVWLDAGGSIPRAAARLHLHRTSLHYRLRQVADITGLDLDDGRHRLVLHSGLRQLDLAQGAEQHFPTR